MRRVSLSLVVVIAALLTVGVASALGDAPLQLLNTTLAASPLAASPAATPDPNGDVTCTGLAPPVVPHDLIVPPGVQCGAVDSTIGHDLLVEPTGRLVAVRVTVGHDIIGDRPDFVELQNGGVRSVIGHDLIVNGEQGFLNIVGLVCNAQINHNLVWRNSTGVADIFGDADLFCRSGGQVQVGHDGVFQGNAEPAGLEISDNNLANNGGFGHDLSVLDNGLTTVESNSIGHDCHQQNNHPYTNDDGDSTGANTAGHDVDACNTPNP